MAEIYSTSHNLRLSIFGYFHFIEAKQKIRSEIEGKHKNFSEMKQV
jgi:hypothetical protein